MTITVRIVLSHYGLVFNFSSIASLVSRLLGPVGQLDDDPGSEPIVPENVGRVLDDGVGVLGVLHQHEAEAVLHCANRADDVFGRDVIPQVRTGVHK